MVLLVNRMQGSIFRLVGRVLAPIISVFKLTGRGFQTTLIERFGRQQADHADRGRLKPERTTFDGQVLVPVFNGVEVDLQIVAFDLQHVPFSQSAADPDRFQGEAQPFKVGFLNSQINVIDIQVVIPGVRKYGQAAIHNRVDP